MEKKHKRVLVIVSGPRKKGNSARLAQEFARGASDIGHETEYVELDEKELSFCRGCLVCHRTHQCVIPDGTARLAGRMRDFDVIAFATPVYFYGVCAQLKTLFDRTNPLYQTPISFRDIYLLASAAESEPEAVEGTVRGVQGWIDCFDRVRLAGTVFAGGVEHVGDVEGHPALEEAYRAGYGI